MMRRRHRVCGFGNCMGLNVRFKSDADARRHWNAHHRGDGDRITTDRFGKALYYDDEDDEEDGYYSEAA